MLVLIRFWLRLPKRTRILLFGAAALYVLGAVGFEIIGGYVAVNVSMGMKLSFTILAEESLEMIGATVASYALLDCLRFISPHNTLEVR